MISLNTRFRDKRKPLFKIEDLVTVSSVSFRNKNRKTRKRYFFFFFSCPHNKIILNNTDLFYLLRQTKSKNNAAFHLPRKSEDRDGKDVTLSGTCSENQFQPLSAILVDDKALCGTLRIYKLHSNTSADRSWTVL